MTQVYLKSTSLLIWTIMCLFYCFYQMKFLLKLWNAWRSMMVMSQNQMVNQVCEVSVQHFYTENIYLTFLLPYISFHSSNDLNSTAVRKPKILFKISVWWRFLLRAEHLFLGWASGCSCFLILSAERESLSVSHASLTALLIYSQQKVQRCTGGRRRCKQFTAVFVWLMCVSHLNKALLLLHP